MDINRLDLPSRHEKAPAKPGLHAAERDGPEQGYETGIESLR